MFRDVPPLRDALAAGGLTLALGACILATVTDVTSRRIPNIACAAVLLGGGLWALAGVRSGTTNVSLAVAMALLVWGTWMHRVKVLGGGDVKMLVAITAWLPVDHLAVFVLWGSIGSLLTAGLMRFLTRRDGGDHSVPLAVAFLCGMLAVFRPLLERAVP